MARKGHTAEEIAANRSAHTTGPVRLYPPSKPLRRQVFAEPCDAWSDAGTEPERRAVRTHPVQRPHDPRRLGGARGLEVSLGSLTKDLLFQLQVRDRGAFSDSSSFRPIAWSPVRPPYSLRQR